MRPYGAEFFGTFWLVLGGCGSAVLAAAFPNVGIGLLGVALAFGLTRADDGLRHRAHLRLPPQSGGVDRPLGRRPVSRRRELLPYIVAQVLGGIAGAAACCTSSPAARQASTSPPASPPTATAAHSPGGYCLTAALSREVVMTLMFLFVILGATDKRRAAGASRRSRSGWA